MIPICLSIAGSDSSGGAGIQADLKTFASLGCYGASVITALTAQNTKGIRSISDVKPDFVRQQLEAVLDDLSVSVVKIGMLGNPDIVQVLVDTLSPTSIPIVLDPIRFSTSGTSLFRGKKRLCEDLLPMCSLITPNRQEALWLTDIPKDSRISTEVVGDQLIKMGVNAVLITGGDDAGKQKRDCLKVRDQGLTRQFEHHTIDTQNSHGTGCTLSSAIAAFLAKGNSLELSVEQAIRYVQACLVQSIDFYTGKGNGGLNHFHEGKSKND